MRPERRIDAGRFIRRAVHAQSPGVPLNDGPMPHADDATQPPSMADLFRANATFVMRVVRRMGVPRGDVEDVAQEVFVLVQQKLAQYDPRRPLRPWLFGIASRMAVGHLRRAQATRARHAAAEPPQPPGADP